MLAELEALAANIDREPGAVGRRAAELIEPARNVGDLTAAATAATLAARARRDVREIEAAELAIDRAIELAAPVGGDVLADAHLVAASIATHRRGPTTASRHLELAAQHASDALIWKITIQQAVLAYRAGRLAEATDLYEQALPAVRRTGDGVMLARVLSNRGLVQTLRGDLDGAVRDFEEARDLFEAADQDAAVAFVLQNHGEALVRRGDVPAAVQLLDEAARRLADHGQPMHDATTSKAEALLSVGLFVDAAELLSDAADGLLADGDRAGAARATLLQATALRLAGDPASRELARRARAEFAELGLAAYEAQAELEMLRAAVVAGDPSALADAEVLSEFFTTHRHVGAAIETLSLTTLLALAAGEVPRAEALAAQCRALAATMPFVEHRLAATHAIAAVDAALGHRDRALESITAILTEFDRYRASIGTPDGRRASVLHAAQLLALGARLVAETGDAATVLAWTERRRLADHTTPADRCGDDVDTIVNELRSVIDELRQVETDAAPSGRDETTLLEHRRLLERQVTECLLPAGAATEGVVESAGRPDDERSEGSAEALIGHPSFGSTTGLSLDVHDGELVAVVVCDRTARLVSLAPADEVVRTADSARALLSALARGDSSTSRRESLDRRLRTALARLDEIAVTPLGLGDGPVVMALPDELHAAPWCAVPSLRDRCVTLTSSLGAWAHSRASMAAAVDEPSSVAAIAGPRLAHADAEIDQVAGCYRDALTIRPGESPISAVIDAFHRADIVHIAAHARLRHDNPMWSTIELAEAPLFAYRLVRDADPPTVVVLATCDSAVSTGPAGAALTGFASALVDGGVATVIAAITELPDSDETVRVMASLHRHLAAGTAPAAALARVRGEHPDDASATVLTCWGRG